MSSPYRNPKRRGLAASFLAASLLVAAPALGQPPDVPVTTLFPGGGAPPPEDARGKIYQGDPYSLAQGKRLFDWYNCSGCHFHGGGGIGPAFLNNEWRYGGRIDQIFDSIYQGRPNGMPSWGGKLSDVEIWELAAFVRSYATPGPAYGAGNAVGEYKPQPSEAAGAGTPPPAAPPPESATPAAQPPAPANAAPGSGGTPPAK